MFARFYGPKSFVVIYFLGFLCVQSLHAQRLAPRNNQSRNSSRQSIFNRLFSPFQNLVQEVTPLQNGNEDANLLPPETFLSTPEIIRFHGYPVEEHKVTTTDGYIISIFQIIQTKKDENSAVKLEPVLIQHGLLCSSDDFLQLDAKDILPYLLVDSGHNVWLGNIRGNTYGKQHTGNISENDPKFYDFSMDDAARDTPEIIKYILKVENVPQLSYVCHSMGCSLISIAVSEEPELNKVIKKGSFLAPSLYCNHVNSPPILAILSLPHSFLLNFSRRYARGRFIPRSLSLALTKFTPGICMRENTRHFCDSAIFFLGGFNPGQITNKTLFKVFGHFPADTSMKLYVHQDQFCRAGLFQKYDYGMEKNLELYGSINSPSYNLSRVTFPVQGFYGLGDNLTPPKDALRTYSELGNVVEAIQVEDEKWTHLDFLYGKDARKLVYEKIVQFLSA